MKSVLDIMKEAAEQHTDELREFRLTGDISHLQSFVEATIAATQMIDWDEFYAAITQKENDALKEIREDIGGEGYISIVKKTQKTGISRPVYDSLLKKMKAYGVAEIENKGVKGTYIKFN